MINSPFDPLPTEIGEYTALLIPFNDDAKIHNRRWFDGRNWSSPYFVFDSEQKKARARSQVSKFNLYWKSK